MQHNAPHRKGFPVEQKRRQKVANARACGKQSRTVLYFFPQIRKCQRRTGGIAVRCVASRWSPYVMTETTHDRQQAWPGFYGYGVQTFRVIFWFIIKRQCCFQLFRDIYSQLRSLSFTPISWILWWYWLRVRNPGTWTLWLATPLTNKRE